MGVEHSLIDRLWDYAVAAKPQVAQRLPKPRAGELQPKDLKDSPNQRALRRSIWCLEATLANDEKAWNDAVQRALVHFDEMHEWGHMSDGPNGRTEIFTASHKQLWYAPMAAFLWAGHEAANKNWNEGPAIINDATRFWRLETAVAQLCSYTDNTGWHMLVPQARAGEPKPNKPMGSSINPAMDNVVRSLIDGWGKGPRTPKVGSYSAAIPLLKNAFAVGANRASLVGSENDLARIPARLGWHLKGRAPGDYYAWFTDLGFVYDGLHGAGHVNGETVLKWTHDEAVEFAESIP